MSKEMTDSRALELQVKEQAETINKLQKELEASILKNLELENSSILSNLEIPMRAALEAKWNALPQEVRIASVFPNITSCVERYILRQMVREANGKLASQKRPGWDARILQWAPALNSLSETVKAQAILELRKVSEEFDSKEAVARIKKYKIGQDTTSTDPHILEVCKVFGIDASNLK